MARFPSLPLFIDAYLADTGHLTDAEHGRYLLLLIHMWRVPGCRLPNDDAWLARHFRKSVEQVRDELRPIISEFMETDGNWITQKRLVREYRFVTIAHEKRSVAAKSREYKKKDKHNAYAPTPTPTPTQEKKKKEVFANANTVRGRGCVCPADFIPNEGNYQEGGRLHFSRADVDGFGREMREWSAANSNRPIARKANWYLTLNNWMRRRCGAAKHNGTVRVMTLKERKQQEWQDAYDKLSAAADRVENGDSDGETVVRLFPSVASEQS